MTLEEVIAELKASGIGIDIELLRRHNTSEEALLEVERNLWNFHRSILAQRHQREITSDA